MPRPASATIGNRRSGGINKRDATSTPGPAATTAAAAAPAATHTLQSGRPSSAQSRRRGPSRASSAASRQGMAKMLVTETEYLEEQVNDILKQQASVNAEHQRRLLTYRHDLRRLYNENAVLRNIITAGELRCREGTRTSANGGPASVTEAESEHLSLRLYLATRRRNRVIADIATAEKALMKEEGTETEMLATVEAAETDLRANRPLFLRVQRLERRLNDVMKQQGMIGVVTKGYYHHLAALRDECKCYNIWMQNLEQEYTGRHRDYHKLTTLYQNAQRDFLKAAQERANFVGSLSTARKAKEKALQEKKIAVGRAIRETQKQELRCVDLQQQLEEEAQLLEAADTLNEQLEQDRLNARSLAAILTGDDGADKGTILSPIGRGGIRGVASTKDEERLAAYQKAFRSMMAGAHVNTLDDLIGVFEEEYAREVALSEQVAEKRLHCEIMQAELKSLRARAANARSCGVSHNPTASAALEKELAVFVGEEEAELASAVQANEENEALLCDIVHRVNEQVEKIADYRPDVAIPHIYSAKDVSFHVHVAVLTQKILALADDATRVQEGSHCSGVAVPSSAAGIGNSIQLVVPENNVRVPIKQKDQEKLRSDQYLSSINSNVAKTLLQRRQQQQQLLQQRMPSITSDSGNSSWVSFHAELRSRFSNDSGTGGLGGGRGAGFNSDDDNDAESSDADSATSEAGGSYPSDGDAGAASGRRRREPPTYARVSNDDPLKREEVKKMSEVIQARERRRREKEERRRSRPL